MSATTSRRRSKAPKKYEAQWLPSPIDIDERRVGKMAIRHQTIKVGEEVPIVGFRQALLRGMPPVFGRATEPLRIHNLVEVDKEDKVTSMWMSDNPEELNQIGEMLFTIQPHGSVLIGGLGLGVAASCVAHFPGVTDVTVVERSRDVIELCAQPDLFRTKRQSILPFLRTCPDEFRFYLLDTWRGTGEGDWWYEVLPLRRAIRERWGMAPTIHCWAEDIMAGQLISALTRKRPPHWFYRYLPNPMSEQQAKAFIEEAGTTTWEDEYGYAVDRAAKEVAKARI